MEKQKRSYVILREGSKILEAMKIMYPFPIREKEVPLSDALKYLGLFSSVKTKALLETAQSDAQVFDLIEQAADVIITTAKGMPKDEWRKLSWGENNNQMLSKLYPKFSTWFAAADEVVALYEIEEDLSKEIEWYIDRMLRQITALISTEEEAEQYRQMVNKKFDELSNKVEKSKLDKNRKEKLQTKIRNERSKVLAFVDEKLDEDPVHVLYYRRGSKIAVKVNLNKSSYRYSKGFGLRKNTGSDRNEFPLIVPFDYLENFLFENEVRYEDVLVDVRSLDKFYRFLDVISIELTPEFVRMWYNYDCPDLERITPNKDRYTNFLEMPLPHFTTNLIEASYHSIYVDEKITDEEAKALCDGYEGTRITQAINIKLLSRSLSKQEVERMKDEIEAYDARIQKIIDEHEMEILNKMASEFAGFVLPTKKGKAKLVINEEFGFDLGFLYVEPRDNEYVKKRQIVREYFPVSRYMDLRLPHPSQSTTVQKAQFNIIKDIVLRETGIQLIGFTQLD